MPFIKVNAFTGEKDEQQKDITVTKVYNTQRVWEMKPVSNGTELNVCGFLVVVKEDLDTILESMNPEPVQE